MIWTENRTTKKSIHTQRVLEAYLREKNATQQPHQRWKLRSQLCLKYSQAILISCWFFFPAWERRYYDFALVVLFIIRSLILAKVNECFLSLLLSSLSLFYRCDGFLSLLLEFFFSVCCFWCYGVPEIASTLTTKLVSSQPQKWHAIAIRMNDLSFQLDLMYIPCSIVQFSRYERQCRTDIICWEKKREREREKKMN